jgi:branched-chain amino acid transport system permease protein
MGENVNKTVKNGKQRRVGPIDKLRNLWHSAPWWQRWAVYAFWVVFAFAILPTNYVGQFLAPGTDWLSILVYPIGTFILLCVGLNVVVGQAGLLDLGYVAFFAVGAYTMAYFTTAYGWNYWATVVVAIGIAGLSGVLLGAPTLRLRGDYLAIVTLGFGEIVRITAQNSDQFSEQMGGARGITNIPSPPPLLGLDFADLSATYYLLVVMIVLVIIFAKRLENSRVGRAWAAIREDEDAAELMGVPTFKFKLLSFAIGAMIGGFAGSYYASFILFIQPKNFPFILSATILAAVILAGAGNIMGMLVGGFIVAWLPEFFRLVPFLPENVSQGLYEGRVMLFAAVLVLLMIFRPEGLWPSRQRKAEMREGTGGMGSMGAEVAGPTSEGASEVTK